MESIFENVGKELNWTQVQNIGYVLHAHDAQTGIAVLQVQGVFGSKANGNCSDGAWEFKRVGMLQNSISVQSSSSSKQLAIFKKNKLNANGTLEFIGGKTVTVNRNALMTEYNLLQENKVLVSFHHQQNRPQVFIDPAAVNTPELPLLVLFLGYLVIMQRIDARLNPLY